MGRTASSFFFLKQMETVVASNEVLPEFSVSGETLKACALMGLHFLTALIWGRSIRGVESAKEVRAAWRALFLPDSTMSGKETLGPFFEG